MESYGILLVACRFVNAGDGRFRCFKDWCKTGEEFCNIAIKLCLSCSKYLATCFTSNHQPNCTLICQQELNLQGTTDRILKSSGTELTIQETTDLILKTTNTGYPDVNLTWLWILAVLCFLVASGCLVFKLKDRLLRVFLGNCPFGIGDHDLNVSGVVADPGRHQPHCSDPETETDPGNQGNAANVQCNGGEGDVRVPLVPTGNSGDPALPQSQVSETDRTNHTRAVVQDTNSSRHSNLQPSAHDVITFV